ncbi:hypothetical protein SAM40697_3913 [Streptomyces ambofaciens]|uniref:Uncharacterized protein n=1 Tax=Streptomyces ambofaciens TaxID=1889 RepID=A0ABN4P995_STRAM|nr:hypothetical protein [Streptomyces ambofaciens]ANB07871.1 hypothetical protein SAM40697_3913 [Streptomyces ambofaciens]
MPSFDSSRGRFKLADRHIAVFAHLLDKEVPPAELHHSLTELQQAGLVGPEGELSPLLRELLTALARPVVLIQAEVTGQHGLLNHGLVVGQDAVFSHDAWPGEEESEYVPIEPQTLVWEMARKVKLRRATPGDPDTAEVSGIQTTMGVLDEIFTAVESGPDDVAAAKATALDALSATPRLSEPERSQLVELVLSMDSSWRITAAWEGEQGAQSMRSIAVWDCGHHGYWLRTQPEEPVAEGQVGPHSTLTVVRSSAGEIWDMLADLLPDTEDLAVANA